MPNKNAKIVTLIVAVVLIVLYCFGVGETWGVFRGCNPTNRLLYHFAHSSVLHMGINVWCFVCLVFAFDLPLSALLVAYVIAACTPLWWDTPTIGLSAVCYALMGMQSTHSCNKLRYHSFVSVALLAGLLMPHVNGVIHLYSYVAGVLFGIVKPPARWLIVNFK